MELLVKLLAGFLLGGTVMVAVQHLRIWRKGPAKRLLPLHIALIALSYDLLLVALMTRVRSTGGRSSTCRRS